VAFHDAVDLLRDKYNVDIIIEPGASIVRDACYLVSSVVDIFASDDVEIVVLDTTVNHLPEVFEYQYTHSLLNSHDAGKYRYLLAGSSCLAGDVFGIYAFDKPLEVGSRVIFNDAGAYSQVKANMFNGINLPDVYSITFYGTAALKKRYTFADYLERCGVEQDACI
jgi:carboxynorspermidine decarboxylase